MTHAPFFNVPRNRVGLFAIALILCAGIVGYGGYQGYILIQYAMHTEKERSANLEYTIGSLRQHLSEVKTERDALQQDLRDQGTKVETLAGEITTITGAVGSLEKIRAVDPELLKKYSRIYFLNENYIPKNLADIPPRYLNDPAKPIQFYQKILPHLLDMLESAARDGVTIQIISAYRSFGTQSLLKSAYSVTYGAGTANSFSADQGYSEHQLGTTLDFTTPATGATFSKFEKTSAYAWLTENGYKYGFVLSYPKNNAYYRYEPWHWRFAGRGLAAKLHADGKYFYDLDQREIDAYLISFFD